MKEPKPAALTWTEAAPGLWSMALGETDPFSPVERLAAPRMDALRSLPAAPRPDVADDLRSERSGGRVVISHPLAADEAICGLGLQFFKLNQRGRTRHLRVNSDPRQDTGESHAPVPFYVSSRGYGLFVDTARIVTVCCGSVVRRREEIEVSDRNADRRWRATPFSNRLEIVLPDDAARLFLVAGPSMLDVVRRYNLYFGGGTLPPKWGLGFWHRTPTRFTAQEVLDEALEYRRRDFPCDVIGLEPGWHSKSYPCTYTWSPERFPDPAGFVSTMAQHGFRVNLWEHPWVSPDSPLYEPLAPLSGSHSVWGGLAPDLTLPEARRIFSEQHVRTHVDAGVSGYKLDECDGSELTGHSWMFPAHAQFPSGRDGEQLRQIYGLTLQQLTAELFTRRDRRTYGLVRASGLGASAQPYVLYTDLYDIRDYVRALCNSGFSGLLFSPEIRRAKDAEEWIRRLQITCFSPLAQLNAWSSGTKPWSFPEVEPIVRRFIKLRMRLIPYLYSTFARYHFEGVPPFRPMALGEVPSEVDAFALDDQYWMGDDLIVAPLFPGQSEREVVLPDGVWYDFFTHERVTGGGRVRVERGLDTLPVFVREGAIIPLMPERPHVPAPKERVPLSVRHYGPAPGRFRLYDDDGETMGHVRGEFTWTELAVEVGPNGERMGSVTGEAPSYDRIDWEWIG